MKKVGTFVALACATVALTSNVSHAKNPLLNGVPSTAIVEEKDLASVKGSGPTAAYYSFYGGYYLQQAQYYANYGNYYNAVGYSNATYGSYFSSAASYALSAYYSYSSASNN